jgi:hypothetical protein
MIIDYLIFNVKLIDFVKKDLSLTLFQCIPIPPLLWLDYFIQLIE